MISQLHFLFLLFLVMCTTHASTTASSSSTDGTTTGHYSNYLYSDGGSAVFSQAKGSTVAMARTTITSGTIADTTTATTASLSLLRSSSRKLQIADCTTVTEDSITGITVTCPDLCGPGQDLEWVRYENINSDYCTLGTCSYDVSNCGGYFNASGQLLNLDICEAWCLDDDSISKGITAADDSLRNCVKNESGSWQCAFNTLSPFMPFDDTFVLGEESGVLIDFGDTLPTVTPSNIQDYKCTVVLKNPFPPSVYTSDDFCQGCKITAWNSESLFFDYDCSNILSGPCVAYDSTTGCIGDPTTPVQPSPGAPVPSPTVNTDSSSSNVAPTSPFQPSVGAPDSSSSNVAAIVAGVIVPLVAIAVIVA
jgi:hypothetical protein